MALFGPQGGWGICRVRVVLVACSWLRGERESELTHVHPLDISTTRHFPAAYVTSRLRYRSGLALGVKLGDALISDDASDDWLDWLRSASEEPEPAPVSPRRNEWPRKKDERERTLGVRVSSAGRSGTLDSSGKRFR